LRLGWELIGVMVGLLLTATLFLRVGLFAQFAMMFADVLGRVPLTLDPNAWYFGNSRGAAHRRRAGHVRLPGVVGRGRSLS
jgi:hypothetical protein